MTNATAKRMTNDRIEAVLQDINEAIECALAINNRQARENIVKYENERAVLLEVKASRKLNEFEGMNRKDLIAMIQSMRAAN
jgi:hypothetical protein